VIRLRKRNYAYFQNVGLHVKVTSRKRRSISNYDDTRCYFNVRSKADLCQLNRQHKNSCNICV